MRYTESQIRDAALIALLAAPGCTLTTTQLIEELTNMLSPSGHDTDILGGRSDTYFSQKVRNLVSHKNQSTGLEFRGLADHDPATESWVLTATGRSEAQRLTK